MTSLVEEHNSLINILVVCQDESDFANIRAQLKRLRSLKFNLDWASSLNEGLLRIKSDEYDVCLLDHSIDNKNGLQFLNSIEAHSVNCPIILLSAGLSIDGDMAALRAGATDYLNKDRLQPGILHRAIRFALNRRNSSDITNQLRQKISRLLKSQAMGDLASGLADDLKHTLRRLESNLDLAIGLQKSGADTSGFLNEAKATCLQALGLANNICICTDLENQVTLQQNKSSVNDKISKLVLILDPNPSMAELAKLYLDAGGFKCKSFSNPEFAIEWFSVHHQEVCAIVMDANLTKLSSELCLKKLVNINDEVPIVVSSEVYNNDIKCLLNNGACKFFEKPANYPSLVTWFSETIKN